MRILERRLLRGPNLYSSSPSLSVIAEEGATAAPGLSTRLLALLPGLTTELAAALRLADDALLVDALEAVTMELQRLAGAPGGDSATLTVPGRPRARRIVCGFALEPVAKAALATAALLLETLAAGRDFELQPALAGLRAIAERHAIGASTAAVLAAAQRRRIPSLRLLDEANIFQLGWGRRQRRLEASITGATSTIAVNIASDRQLTKTLLDQAGVPVPRGDVVHSAQEAQRLARELGGKVALKPLDARQGKGKVFMVACATPEDVARAYEYARSHSRRVIVEEHLAGRDYRVLVTGGRIAAASTLAAQGCEDVTELVHEDTRAACLRAARTIGLDVAGIDIVCHDIALPLAQQNGGIIEVKAAPDIGMHQYPSRGKPRDAGDAIAEALFGECDGRIPVVAVTGTNGKTTTTLMIAHAVRMAGLCSGAATTSGVYIDGRLVREGDCAGYRSACSVLAAPEVDFAVLETARGGILRRGLAFDRCDVAVVLNVSADHLGLDGVETIEDLARVKAVVARHASRAVVLNAEDCYCVAMSRQLPDTVETIYFALDDEDPVLLRHIEDGGRAVYLQDTAIVFATGMRHQALVDVRELPASLGGRARYNIANAMAAAAALAACGFGDAEIADGLRSFVCDSKHNPLRSNVFDVDGVTVIVDYAHNCAAYAALAETARAMTPGRLVGVVAAPGDRRDADLVDIGRTCASGFDELVIYETGNRGRPQGETASLLVRGAVLSRIGSEQLNVELDVHRAIQLGLSLCQPGDVLAFGCGSSISDLTEALRPTRPDLADQIALAAI